METILRGLIYDVCLVNIFDIAFGGISREQLDNLLKLFHSIQEANLKLNPQSVNHSR